MPRGCAGRTTAATVGIQPHARTSGTNRHALTGEVHVSTILAQWITVSCSYSGTGRWLLWWTIVTCVLLCLCPLVPVLRRLRIPARHFVLFPISLSVLCALHVFCGAVAVVGSVNACTAVWGHMEPPELVGQAVLYLKVYVQMFSTASICLIGIACALAVLFLRGLRAAQRSSALTNDKPTSSGAGP